MRKRLGAAVMLRSVNADAITRAAIEHNDGTRVPHESQLTSRSSSTVLPSSTWDAFGAQKRGTSAPLTLYATSMAMADYTLQVDTRETSPRRFPLFQPHAAR